MAVADINQVLATNRAEEIGYDVWKQFVLPPFYRRLGIGDARKPKVIIGGRGCGKTMILRYLSHETTFSLDRQQIPNDALSHIGLYWRADTQFASLMQRRDIPDDVWAASFRHLAAVVLGLEVLRSLESIAQSTIEVASRVDLASISFAGLRPFSEELPESIADLSAFLKNRVAEFEVWVNDVRSVSQPRFLPGNHFLKRMVGLIRDQIRELRDVVFFVYIDEYENLAVYQQKIINTWLKHSEPPLGGNSCTKRIAPVFRNRSRNH